MKKMFNRVLMLLTAAFTLTAMAVQAQNMPLPVDQDVRIGKLPNGLTYYIRHNEKPKGQADFYIAQKVGSALEEDSQRGLAHFLEHMCFNGTTNFPGHNLIDWLSSIGVRFGQNLNAYTGVDETVYNIDNVPVARESVQDSCLLILHDWANDLLLEDAEIDSERGVIHEEWRQSMKGNMRIMEKILPDMYPGCKYGYRLPIGIMDVVDNFAYKELRDYYEKWYRPDQQGIIVVGDIDPDRIEKKIMELFSDIEMPANAAERTYEPVPDTPGTIYAIGSDKEQSAAVVQVMFKHDPFPNELKGDGSYYVYNYMLSMIVNMLDNRFNELAKDPAAPFAQAGAQDGNYLLAKTKSSFNVVGIAKDNDIKPVLASIYRELLRALRGGFTVSEYQRARDEYLSQIETMYNNRETRESGSYVQEYVRHFIDNEPIPGIEFEHQLINMIAPTITVEMINQVLPELVGNNVDNRVVVAMLPEKEGVANPTKEELEAIMTAVDAETIEPYKEELKSEPLIPALPKPGTITATTPDKLFGATEFTLSNGVKVLVKKTDFKADEILFGAYAKGGTSTLPGSYDKELQYLEIAMSNHGLGTYTATDLEKYLAGKQCSAQLELDDYSRSLTGSTTPKDLPTLMELIYMTMTGYTISEDDYASTQNMYKGLLANQESTPQFAFQKLMMGSLYPDAPRKQMITPADIDAARRDVILDIIAKETANAADYTFVFVGNIDIDAFKPLMEQYIATLPADAAKATTTVMYSDALTLPAGQVNKNTATAMETPQTFVAILEAGNIEYSAKDRAIANVAGEVWSKRLREKVREEMGAVYSIGGYGSLGRLSRPNAILQTAFPMKPEFKDEVIKFITDELKKMESDIKPDEIAPAIASGVKEATEGKETNGYWLGNIGGFINNGVDTASNDVETYNSITVSDVQDFMKRLNAQGNLIVIALDPEAAPAK